MAKSYSDKLRDPRWQKKPGIYKLIINERIYVGSAVNLKKRLTQHLSDLKSNRHSNIHLQRAFNKYQSIEFDIIEIVSDVQRLIEREQHYIDTLNPQYNIALKAGSQLGFTHTEETKRKLSELQKGKSIPAITKKRMSVAHMGIIFSKAHKINIGLAKLGNKNPFYKAGKSHPQYGIPKSQETRDRISITSKLRGSHKGERNAASKSGVLYDVETGANHIFFSLKPLCEKLGLNYKGIISALRTKVFYRNRYYTDYVKITR